MQKHIFKATNARADHLRRILQLIFIQVNRRLEEDKVKDFCEKSKERIITDVIIIKMNPKMHIFSELDKFMTEQYQVKLSQSISPCIRIDRKEIAFEFFGFFQENLPQKMCNIIGNELIKNDLLNVGYPIRMFNTEERQFSVRLYVRKL